MSETKESKVIRFALLLCLACTVVGALAAMGKFNSMMNFPVVFAGICLAIGAISLWRDRPRKALGARAGLVLLGASLAVGGWLYQKDVIRRSFGEIEIEAFSQLGGKPAPRLTGLAPLNTGPEELAAAAGFTARATIIGFWATWCSPCWKEMPELEALYRQHRERGLTVVAITRYDPETDDDERRHEFAAAQRFLQKRELTFPAAITDGSEIYRAYRVRSVPSTVLVDAEGRIAAYAVGLESARELMREAVRLVTPGSG